MKPLFDVRVLRFAVLREIAGAWTNDDYVTLLEAMEYGDTAGVSANEIYDVCVMALQDLKPEAAAEIVLHHQIGKRLTRGEITNVAHEMADQKLWEEYADLSLHERMFNVGSLMYAAFPRYFPEPDAVSVTLEVTATDEATQTLLAPPLHESFLVRLLADGMDGGSALHRLFDDQLRGTKFPEADTIVWIASCDRSAANAATIDAISSGFWLDALRETRAYQSNAYADS